MKKIIFFLLIILLGLAIVIFPTGLITLIWCDKSYNDIVTRIILTDFIAGIILGIVVGIMDDYVDY